MKKINEKDETIRKDSQNINKNTTTFSLIRYYTVSTFHETNTFNTLRYFGLPNLPSQLQRLFKIEAHGMIQR